MAIEERINQNSSRLSAQRKDEQIFIEKLNNSEHQISQLKAQLQHTSAGKQDEIERLQKKLGFVKFSILILL